MKEGLEKGRELGLLEGRVRGYSQRVPPQDRRAFEQDEPPSPSSGASSFNYRASSSRPAQPPPRPPSRTNSVAQSIASRRSVETHSQHEVPIPVPPPVLRESSGQQPTRTPQAVDHEIAFSRPVSLRNRTPSPVHPPTFIPPDNYIPRVDADNVIRLPPPHEFHRSPSNRPDPLPDLDVDDRRQANSRTGTPYRRARRHSSPESNSTTISQLDLVNDPNNQGMRTPMSAIPEVLSSQTSPNQQIASGEQEPELRRQPSFAGSTRTHRSQKSTTTVGIQGNAADLRAPIYTRPRTTSGSTVSTVPPPEVAQRTLGRPSQSSLGSVPPISVQAPSSPSNSGTIPNEPPQLNTPATNRQPSPLPAEPPSFSLPSPPPEQASFPAPIVLDSNELPPNFVPMSYTPGPSFVQLQPTNNEANTSGDGPPVIPDSALFGTDSDDSENASSLDTLTTPPHTWRQLDRSQSRASDAGTHYTGVQVPLPPSTVAGTPRSAWLGGTSAGGAARVPLPPSTIASSPRLTREGTNVAGAANVGFNIAGLEGVPLPPSAAANTPRWGGFTIGKTPGSKSRSSSRSTKRAVS
ncbi:hypothetical protein AX15_004240 [Amanita polypyramis BW_CC]|nr:hypothetical protein AX15_004240 [Amanita polypyramis BW_CC]